MESSCLTEEQINSLLDVGELLRHGPKEVETPIWKFRCEKCQGKLLLDKELICQDCGLVHPNITEEMSDNVHFESAENNNKSSSGNTQYTPVAIGNRYRTSGHMKEVLAQRKGEGGNVDPTIVEEVRRMYRIYKKPFDKATEEFTILLMRKIGLRNIYEHAVQITSEIKNVSPEWLNPEQDSIIQRMYKQAEVAWINAPLEIKKGRSNMPHSKDFIKRCCLYQGYYEKANKMKSLKTPKSIREMNKIWAYFGEKCGWVGWKEATLPER